MGLSATSSDDDHAAWGLTKSSSAVRSLYRVCVQILNRIKEHAGLFEAAPFTQEIINGTEGFGGRYNVSGLTPDDHEALRLLRKFYGKDQQDLHRLVDTLYPDSKFSVEMES